MLGCGTAVAPPLLPPPRHGARNVSHDADRDHQDADVGSARRCRGRRGALWTTADMVVRGPRLLKRAPIAHLDHPPHLSGVSGRPVRQRSRRDVPRSGSRPAPHAGGTGVSASSRAQHPRLPRHQGRLARNRSALTVTTATRGTATADPQLGAGVGRERGRPK